MSRRLALATAAAGMALALAAAASARAAQVQIVNANNPGEGFSDPTPVAPVAGNPGTTRGEQRLNAFAAAAAYWANRVESAVPIQVLASMRPLTCSPTSGILGSAGPVSVARDFGGAPRPNTWYVAALANAMTGTDLHGGADLVAHFNSRLDSDPGCLGGRGWWYGVGAAPPGNAVSFYATVLHEIGHGLGFLTLVSSETGERFEGFDDAYMAFLEDHSTGKGWTAMTDAERAASAQDTGDLHWTGPAVVAAGGALQAGRHPGGHVQMYAPAPVRGGSSVSHWDTALVPDELMEPRATPNPVDVVTTALLADLGWNAQAAGDCLRDADTACLVGGRFAVEVEWRTAAEGGVGRLMSFGSQRAESQDSSFWWFFGPTNYELGVKVLDGCAVNGHFWVFASGLTNQGWTVTVRDGRSGLLKTYDNPLGTLSPAFADTRAFRCN